MSGSIACGFCKTCFGLLYCLNDFVDFTTQRGEGMGDAGVAGAALGLLPLLRKGMGGVGRVGAKRTAEGHDPDIAKGVRVPRGGRRSLPELLDQQGQLLVQAGEARGAGGGGGGGEGRFGSLPESLTEAGRASGMVLEAGSEGKVLCLYLHPAFRCLAQLLLEDQVLLLKPFPALLVLILALKDQVQLIVLLSQDLIFELELFKLLRPRVSGCIWVERGRF